MKSMDGLVWLLVILVPGAVAATLWISRRERRQTAELRQARADLHDLADMLDVWQWRSDADHRLVWLRPPHGAAPADWAAAATTGPLWEALAAKDPAALRARLASRAPLNEIAVLRPGAGGVAPSGQSSSMASATSAVSAAATAPPAQLSQAAQPARLRGRARTDLHGMFIGYAGTLQDEPVVASREVEPKLSDHESFSYTVSHDLRAPIRVVEGFTKILKEDYGRLLDRIGNDHLDRVLGAANRMNAMIDALLALARLSSRPLASQSVDLTLLAGYVAEDLRRQWPERPVVLHLEPGLQAQGDPTLLRVLLENLLGNAWKYTGKCAAPEIWFERGEGPHCFVVRDNGAGFDMRFADRLFGVFQRLHSASDFQGTGIGLASVQRIVRRHGGEIRAEAEVDRGARFQFTLG